MVYVYMYLQASSESQGHGKPWEVDILEKLAISTDILNLYSHTSKYDAKKEHLNYNKNISIKTTKSMNLCCSDIIRFLTECEELDIIVILYIQATKRIKEAIKTYLINYDLLIQKLKEDIPKIYGITYETWINNIKEYVKTIKSIPHGRFSDKSYKEEAKKLSENIPYFNVNPKVDSGSQRRVQCSINMNKITIDETYEGGIFKNITYTKEIISEVRKRGGLTIDNMKKFCILNNIKGNGVKGGFPKKKEELLKYITDKITDSDDLKKKFEVLKSDC